ncbi:MAG TPA: GNAT family N-acetyltransferase [Dermatophilaceae bacterium]|nr:GNAT family N-acetyltransferase [Dermatophilaceae bacterium]
MEIRDATADDLAAIAPVFRAIVAEGETFAYPEDLTDAQIGQLWMEGPPGRCIVAYAADGTFLGTAKTGPNRPGRGDHIATASFMVAPAAQGHGVGRALAEEVLTWATEQGYAAMQFNAVVETNMGAVALWQQLGFRIVGTVPGAFRSKRNGTVGLHVMYRDLAGPDADPGRIRG